MRAHRSILDKVLFSSAVCLLLCAIVSAEIPELVALTDNTSNDFTMRKASGREVTPTLSAATHRSVPLDAEASEHNRCACDAPIFTGAAATSPDLFLLDCVFRR
jgi:hypothetical protein